MLYVFEVRMEECMEAFKQLFPDKHSLILILYDTVYYHCIGDLARVLNQLTRVLISPSAELKQRLSDYLHCSPSLLSLPHPVTSSYSTNTACSCTAGAKSDDGETETDVSHSTSDQLVRSLEVNIRC